MFRKTMKTPPFMLRLLDALDVLKPYQVNLWFIGGSFLIGGICPAVGYWHFGTLGQLRRFSTCGDMDIPIQSVDSDCIACGAGLVGSGHCSCRRAPRSWRGGIAR